MLFPTTKFHEGPAWERLLKLYDEIAYSQFIEPGGESRTIFTTYGDTRVHMRGNPSHPPLAFFHGISTNSLMFGDWLVPKLSQDYYCVCIDTIGDMGASCPKDNDPANGPQTEEDVADWAFQLFRALHIHNQPVHLLGYSMGAFLACCVARHSPVHAVGKVVLLAPAGVVGTVRMAWLARAIAFAMIAKFLPKNSFLLSRMQLWFFGSMMAEPAANMKNLRYPELRQATDEVGMAQVWIKPTMMAVETLQQMTVEHPTVMMIGRQESVIDPTHAIEHAQKSNMNVIVYENAGHMFFAEHPRERAIDDVKHHLES